MFTKKLFKDDVYKKECTAVVTEIRKSEDHTDIILDQTIFFPEGGGQPSDKGMLILEGGSGPSAYIEDVQENGDLIIHRTPVTDPLPNEGDHVLCRLDWNRRLTNMQRHCGEHILSGVFADMYGGANRGFHMGESYITDSPGRQNSPTQRPHPRGSRQRFLSYMEPRQIGVVVAVLTDLLDEVCVRLSPCVPDTHLEFSRRV